MKITFFDGLETAHKDLIEQELSGNEIEVIDKNIHESITEVRDDIEIAVVFVYSQVSKEVIEKLPNLKLIVTRSTGFDHIDLKTAADRDISVSNVPYYGENTVAEHTFALLLSLARHIPRAIDRVKNGSFTYEGLRGVDIKGKTLGIVGGGHIGLNVVRIANGFGMNVMVYDVIKDPQLAVEYNFTYEDELPTLLSKSDFVSLHAPLNQHTFHLLNKEMFKHIKPGAYLINTARGALVESNALLHALQEGRISGAGLDVLEGENYLNNELSFLSEEHTEEEMKQILEDQILIGMENVIITPHIAFNTDEAHLRIIQTTIENIKNFIEGKPSNSVS